MKKKLLSLILVATMSFGITACGNSTDSKSVAELEEQIEELQQQLERAKAGSSTSTSSFDSETQALIDSINANTAEYQGVCGADARWYYKDNVLVIKGTGDVSDDSWLDEKYDSRINWVIIDEGITQISCKRAFTGATSLGTTEELSKIILPSTLTDIGPYAFSDTKINSIVLPEGLTKISDGLLDNCESLKSVVIPNSVTEIGFSAFSGCSSLTEVTLPDNVTEIGKGAFVGCDALDDSTRQKIETINPDAFY